MSETRRHSDVEFAERMMSMIVCSRPEIHFEKGKGNRAKAIIFPRADAFASTVQSPFTVKFPSYGILRHGEKCSRETLIIESTWVFHASN